MHWHSDYRNNNKFCWLNILIVFGVWNVAFATESTNILPCDYADSVNITAGILQPNKSYTFNGIEYPEGHYAKIDYTIFDGKIIPQTPYIRGCVCNVQKCIRFCCPYGKYLEIKDGVGRCHHHESAKHIEGEIINHNNETKRIKYRDHFAILHTFPCKNLEMPGEQYSITHDGHAVTENQTYHQQEYCLMASLNKSTNSFDMNLAICTDPNGGEFEAFEADWAANTKYYMLPMFMLLSVLFIIATLIVYGCVPKIRHLHEKCLMCYLVVLASAFTLISLGQLSGYSYFLEDSFCIIVPYALEFSFISVFLWLNVINFDLWLSFQSAYRFKKLGENVQFACYLMYGYGIPSLLTLMIFIINRLDGADHDFSSCYLFNDQLLEFVFFYLPAAISLPMNIVLFVLILKRIQYVQHEAKRLEEGTLRGTDSKIQKFLDKKKKKSLIYLKLFIVTGLSWIVELLTLFLSSDVFFYTDIFNSLQGVYIFIIFVWNRRVLRLTKQRWNEMRGIANTDGNDDSISCTNDADDYLRLGETEAVI